MTTEIMLYQDIDAEYRQIIEAECPECHGDGSIYDVQTGTRPCPCEGSAERVLAPILARLSRISEEVSVSALKLARVERQLDKEAAYIEAQARYLTGLAAARRKRQDALKLWIKLQMEAGDVRKVKDPLVMAWVQDNPLALDVVDEALVPARYKRATVTLPLADLPPEWLPMAHVEVMKRDMIEELRTDGVVAPGCEVRRGTHLRIKG